MTRISILLADMRPLLRDIVIDAIASEPDVEVTEGRPQESIEDALTRVNADVLIVATRQPNLSIAEGVWSRWPRVKVLMIADGGREAFLYLLRPDKIVLRDVSPKSLVAAIRGEDQRGVPY